jgi:hypothetical protein
MMTRIPLTRVLAAICTVPLRAGFEEGIGSGPTNVATMSPPSKSSDHWRGNCGVHVSRSTSRMRLQRS